MVGEAGSGREAIRMAEELDPQIIIMDIAMPQFNGIDAAEQVLRKNPEVRIIMLSMYTDEEFLTRSLAAGVKGYLLKDSAEVDLVPAVRAVVAGKNPSSSSRRSRRHSLKTICANCKPRGCKIPMNS